MKIRKRKGKRNITYSLDYRVNGYRRVESLGRITKRQAELIMAQRQEEIAEGRFPIIKDYKKTSFFDICDEFLEWSRAHKRSYTRDEGLVKNLKSYFGNIPLFQITRRRAEEYQAWRVNQKKKSGKLISKATVNREVACLKRIFNKAIEWGKVRNNPVSRIKMFPEERKLRFFNEAELEKLLAYAPKNLKPVIIVAVLTGMRSGELRHLTWKNINFDLSLIYLERTKTGKMREIPMGDTVREILWGLKKKSNSEYVFVNERREPYKWPLRIDKVLKKVGIENASTNTLRHTCASWLMMANQNLKVIQELLGHANISTTMRYAHLSPNAKTKAVQVLDTELKAVTTGNKTVTKPGRATHRKVIPLELVGNKRRFDKAGVAQLVEQRFRKP